MSILMLLIWIALIGFGAWALVTYVPMTPGIQTVIKVAAVILAIILILNATGLLNTVSSPMVPRVGGGYR
jgi:hypothetical protein